MLGIPAVTLLIIGGLGGIGAAGTFLSFHVAEKIGDQLEPEDLLPMPPPNPPVPRFFVTKPHLVEKLKKSLDEE